jgi:hypothetical protein
LTVVCLVGAALSLAAPLSLASQPMTSPSIAREAAGAVVPPSAGMAERAVMAGVLPLGSVGEWGAVGAMAPPVTTTVGCPPDVAVASRAAEVVLSPNEGVVGTGRAAPLGGVEEGAAPLGGMEE